MTTWWEANGIVGVGPGQLGGEEIFVETITDKIGRRLVSPLLPGSDQRPPSIDLGRTEAPWSVTAYVHGDYLPTYRRLRTLFDAPGPYTFLHPYLGEFNVDLPDGVEIEQAIAQGGIAYLRFTAIPASEALPYSEPIASPRDQVLHKGKGAVIKLQAGFEKRWKGLPFLNALSLVAGFIRGMASALDNAAARARSFLSPVSDLTDALQDLRASAERLAGLPGELARTIGGLINAIMSFGPDASAGTADAGAETGSILDALDTLTRWEAYPPEDHEGLESETIDEIAAAFECLLGGLALAEAQVAMIEIPSESAVEAEAIAETFAETADSYLFAPGVDEDTEEALVDLRTSWAIYVSSATLPEVQEITLPTERSAIVLAMELYGDPTRGEEIAALNDILESSFLPAGVPLKVLTT